MLVLDNGTNAGNRRYENPESRLSTDGFDAVCPTCGRWVPPTEALDTDEGRFHDRLNCLSEDSYEELVTKYACRCSVVAPRRGGSGEDESARCAEGAEPKARQSGESDAAAARVGATTSPRSIADLHAADLLGGATEDDVTMNEWFSEYLNHLDEEHEADRSMAVRHPIDRVFALKRFTE